VVVDRAPAVTAPVAVTPPRPAEHALVAEMRRCVVDFVERGDWEQLMRLGDIYAKGAYPSYVPDDTTALLLYSRGSRCANPDVAGLAQSKYVSTRLSPVRAEDRRGAALPVEFGRLLCETADERLRHEGATIQRRRSTRRPRPNDPPPAAAPMAVAAPPPAVVPVTVPANAVDTQNVHDHAVVSATLRNVEAIVTESADQSALDEVVAECRRRLTGRSAEDAAALLRQLSSARHSNYGVSEKDALSSVWKTIQGVCDEGVRDNLTETLTTQLAACVEGGLVVCSTGRIARIMGTLEGVPEVARVEKAVPMSVVNQELGALASAVRTEHLARMSADDVQQYETVGVETISAEMKKDFGTRAHQTYVEELKLSASVISPLIGAYAAEL
jgi:hypothetical protein